MATTAVPPPPPPVPERPILGRYQCVSHIGTGTHGFVYKATVCGSGDLVAVKCMRPGANPMRFRQEAVFLGMVRLPGVVELIDYGMHDGTPVLVTRYFEGRRFPGVPAPATWDQIREPARQLLLSVGSIHANLVLHRDLKPSNVVVAEDGRATVLDFSIAKPEPDGVSNTAGGPFAGTEWYAAPEQFEGGPLGSTTDLWAVGAMLYEALSGHVPHKNLLRATNLSLRHLRTSRPPTRLQDLAAQLAPGVPPEVPPEVFDAIDSMLRMSPSERPQSAFEALHRLGFRDDAGWVELPWLGQGNAVEEARRRVRMGLPIRISGARGTGTTRLLRELADFARELGKTPIWLTRSDQPYGSLLTHVPAPVVRASGDPESPIVQAVERAVRAGAVWFVDRGTVLDEDSEALLSAHSDWPVVRIVAPLEPSEVYLTPISADDLRDLFVGHEFVWHIPTDAAEQLHRYTGGIPTRVRATVGEWLRHEWVSREAADTPTLRMDREHLDALRLRTHQASIPLVKDWRVGREFAPRSASGSVTTPSHPEVDASRTATCDGAAIETSQPPAPTLPELVRWLNVLGPRATRQRILACTGWEHWQLGKLVDKGVNTGEMVTNGDVVTLCRVTAHPMQLEHHRSRAALTYELGDERRMQLQLAQGLAPHGAGLLAESAYHACRSLLQRGELLMAREAAVVGCFAAQMSTGTERDESTRLESFANVIVLASLHLANVSEVKRGAELLTFVPSTPSRQRNDARQQLLRTTAAVMASDRTVEQIRVLETLPLDDPDQLAWAVLMAGRVAASTLSDDELESKVPAWQRRLEERHVPAFRIAATLANVRAFWAWRGEKHRAAAEFYELEAHHETYPHREVTARANAVVNWMATLELDNADRANEAAFERLDELRAFGAEAQALLNRRWIRYRRGHPPAADDEQERALLHAAPPDSRAQVHLLEAASSRRRDEPSRAAAHAQKAWEIWSEIGRTDCAQVAASLWALVDDGARRMLRVRLAGLGDVPGAKLTTVAQAAALATMADSTFPVPPGLRSAFLQHYESIPVAHRDWCYDVLSPNEIRAALVR